MLTEGGCESERKPETLSPSLARAVSLVQQGEHHAGAEVLTGGVLVRGAVEQHEQRTCFNLVVLEEILFGDGLVRIVQNIFLFFQKS